MPKKLLNHSLCNHPPFARLQVTKRDITNLDTNKTQGGKTHCGSHVAHLSVLAFDEGELYPTGRNVGAITDGRHTLPKVLWRLNDFRLTRFGAVAFDGDAFFQLVDCFLSDLPVDLCPIGARMLEFRVKQFLDEPSLVSEEQSTFAVVVEATGSIHPSGEPEFVECPMSRFGSELAEYAVRFVEKNDHNHINLGKNTLFSGNTIGF